jgi:hypothetical protein
MSFSAPCMTGFGGSYCNFGNIHYRPLGWLLKINRYVVMPCESFVPC